MGKRTVAQAPRLEDLTEYEKQRQKRLQFNAMRMEAYGIKQDFVKKILQSPSNLQLHQLPQGTNLTQVHCNLNEKHIVNDEMVEKEVVSSDTDQRKNGKSLEENSEIVAEVARTRSQKYQHSMQVQLHQQQGEKNQRNLMTNNILQKEVVLSEVDQREDGKNQGENSQMSMAEFARTRSRKFQHAMQVLHQQQEQKNDMNLVTNDMLQKEVVLTEVDQGGDGKKTTLSQMATTQFPSSISPKLQHCSQVHLHQQPQELSQRKSDSKKQGFPPQKQKMTSKQQHQYMRSFQQQKQHIASEQQQQQRCSAQQQQQQIASEKKSHKVKFCSPGSLTMFTMMRQRQKQQKQLEDVPDNQPQNEEEEEDVSLWREEDIDLEQGSHDDDQLLSNGNDALANINDVATEPQIITNESAPLSVLEKKKKKHRGPTTMLEVHRRKPSERELIILNARGQPIGPTKACVNKFRNFLGTIAKFPHLAPLNYVSWNYMPTKEKIWDYVQAKYDIPEGGKEYVLESVNALWRVYKSRVKKKHYKAYATDEERLMNRPKNIPIQHFEELLEYWNSELAKEISCNNQKSRGLRVDAHTMGPSSYALLRHDLQQKDPNKQPPSQATVYKESRKRVPGRKYLTNNERTLEKIDKMDTLESQNGENGEENCKDPYYEVVSKDERNHLNLYGRSVTNSKLKRKGKDNQPSYMFPTEFLHKIKEELIREVAPDLASVIVSQIEAANPGVQLQIPNLLGATRDTSSANACPSIDESHEPMNEDNEQGESDN